MWKQQGAANTLLLYLQLLAGFLSSTGSLSQHNPPGRLWQIACENLHPFIQDAPTCVLPQGTAPISPAAVLPCPWVTTDGGDKDQVVLQISASLLPSLLRCRCSVEHLQVVLLGHPLTYRAIFQLHGKAAEILFSCPWRCATQASP